jgi:uncharacterized protein YlxP (DUF503 family)
MYELKIGVGQVSLRLRYAQSLKDKRKVMQSLVQKLRNLGFSVTETGYADSPKQGSLGFAFAGHSAGQVDHALDEMQRLLVGDFEVLDVNKEIVDYSELGEDELDWEGDEFDKS